MYFDVDATKLVGGSSQKQVHPSPGSVSEVLATATSLGFFEGYAQVMRLMFGPERVDTVVWKSWLFPCVRSSFRARR